MDKSATSESTATNAESRLAEFIAQFEPAHQELIRTVRSTLKRRFPTACELIYDNYNFFVIGYSPSARPSDSILSITANASGIGLCFIHGARLPDPAGILLGSGNQTRFVRVPSTHVLSLPEVVELIAAAEALSSTPFPKSGDGQVVIRSVSAKRRPRRKS
jgi:hypothetical protein